MTKHLVDEEAFQEALTAGIYLNVELMSDEEIDAQLKLFIEAYELAKKRRRRMSRKLWDELEDIPNEGDGY